MNVKIVMDSGKEFSIGVNKRIATFGAFLDEMFKNRYYVLFGDNEEVGNVCLDTYKVSYVEII